MSAYSDWHCGAIDKSEYESICRREEGSDREYMERELYKDACYERCSNCGFWVDEDGHCMAGENPLHCTIVG